ncbi:MULTISPECIES: FAD-dependent oxidoreductase [unclassified Ensifer]|uniref:FAD-dependent oxidoreductase n=1 Tax=unclassified Ensifer TaxID=2633371 RepID=UPI00081322CD|nr:MULTISPECIES: FAD-dependent oxidoreductase [unclassified Ensifer]OCP24818.1 amino acid dehydrogenase [Ensifer sp. LC54]OCP25843.1 amino acid dehydrogenase [Ensifer sp. LC384]
MHIGIIGAGVVGVASAYFLARAGHRVTLIDAEPEPGKGASAGNAAQLSWAYGDAMASPALLKHLPGILTNRDPAFRVRLRLDPDFLLWGLRFLANTPSWRWWSNTKDILKLADESRREMALLLAEVDIAFDYRVAGKLHLYPDTASLSAARPIVERKKRLGLDQRMLSRSEAEAVEPALKAYQGEIAGAVYTPDDALGDAAAFCRQLTAAMVKKYGVSPCFGRRVAGFEQRGGRLLAVRFADCDPLPVDAAVVTAGPLIRTLAAALPEARGIQPVAGYSLTVPWREGAPRVSLTDVKRKLAFAAIGERFRVAGLADIEKAGSGFTSDRFAILRGAANAVLPGCFGQAEWEWRWSGERPMTPSSRPLIVKSQKIHGVYINAGHGMLGWTLALGSAGRIASLVA